MVLLLTNGCGAAGYCGLGALVEIIHRDSAAELELKVCVRIDTAGHDQLAGRIDRAAPAGHNKVRTGTDVSAYGTKSAMLEAKTMDRFLATARVPAGVQFYSLARCQTSADKLRNCSLATGALPHYG